MNALHFTYCHVRHSNRKMLWRKCNYQVPKSPEGHTEGTGTRETCMGTTKWIRRAERWRHEMWRNLNTGLTSCGTSAKPVQQNGSHVFISYSLPTNGIRSQTIIFKSSNRAATFPIFASPHCPDWLRAQPALSSGLKLPGCEDGHSSPTGAEIKKPWIYTSATPHTFAAQCLIH
jgi:hypothetical protein